MSSRRPPSAYYAEEAERWMRARHDQDAYREGMAMARDEAEHAKKRAATDEVEQTATRRRR